MKYRVHLIRSYSKQFSQVSTSVLSDDCWSVQSRHICCFVCVYASVYVVCLVVRTGFGVFYTIFQPGHLQLGIDQFSGAPTTKHQLAPTFRIPACPWLYQADQQGAACFFTSLVRVKFTLMQHHHAQEDTNSISWNKIDNLLQLLYVHTKHHARASGF